MAKIKFSHHYQKMPAFLFGTTLIQIWVTDLSELTNRFIEYDTMILGGQDFYKLPAKGKFMVLFLCTGTTLWTTIRRWTPRKETYYRSLIGQEVEIEIDPEGG